MSDYWTDFNGVVHKATGRSSCEPEEDMLNIDALAQEIRRVDGQNSLGAGALAEALIPFLAALSTQQGNEEPVIDLSSIITCTCYDDVSRRLCLKKDRCSVIEAYSAHPPKPAIGEAWTPEFDEMVAADPLLARAASIICEAACGMYSQCNSREAAVALRDAGMLASPPSPNSAVTEALRKRAAQIDPDLLGNSDARLMTTAADELARLRAALTDATAVSVPGKAEGYVLVLKEPTEAMLIAGCAIPGVSLETGRRMYRAMLAAAPTGEQP